jgi:hypothetical protein
MLFETVKFAFLDFEVTDENDWSGHRILLSWRNGLRNLIITIIVDIFCPNTRGKIQFWSLIVAYEELSPMIYIDPQE